MQHYVACDLVEKLKKLEIQQHDLICRISGLTIDELKEQAREEYQQIIEQIEQINTLIEQQENSKFGEIINQSTIELVNFYTEQFIKVGLIQAIELTNNISLTSVLNKCRLRIPKLADRRLLALLANYLDSQIVILDMENVILDDIGTGKTPIKLYVDVLSRVGDISYTTANTIVHYSRF